MRTRIGARLRQARPPISDGWAASQEGRNVLRDVLRTPRGTPVTATGGRRSHVITLVAVLGAAVAVTAVLAIPRLVGSPDESTVTAAALDTYRPGDVAFFDHIQVGGPAAEEVEFYESLSAGSVAASAVIAAEVVDVRETRVITGEIATDQVPMYGVALRPVEVLAGSLRGEYSEELTVEFVGDQANLAQKIDDMKATMPQGQSVWFLRYKGEGVNPVDRPLSANEQETLEGDEQYYRLTSSQGLFIQGKEHVIDPVAAADPESMAAEAESYDTMSQLVRSLRNK